MKPKNKLHGPQRVSVEIEIFIKQRIKLPRKGGEPSLLPVAPRYLEVFIH
jgi:hypothetical protein